VNSSGRHRKGEYRNYSPNISGVLSCAKTGYYYALRFDYRAQKSSKLMLYYCNIYKYIFKEEDLPAKGKRKIFSILYTSCKVPTSGSVRL
jgi:hypothetical protein